MKKWLMIVIPVVLVIVLVLSFFTYVLFYGGTNDGFPSYGTLKVEKTSDSEITFTITDGVWDYYDDPVKFSESAYSLWVDERSLSSDDYTFREHSYNGFIDMNFSKVLGPGASKANVHLDGDVFYVVIFNDNDFDSYLSKNDTIVVKSTEPIRSDIEYKLMLATDIHNGEGHANYIGTLNGPEESGWG